MKILFLFINISFLICIEYAVIYEDNLYEPANTIANLYSNQVDDSFKLDTNIFSKSHIESFNADNFSEKIKAFLLDLKENNPELSYLLILGDENSFPPIYNNTDIPSDDFFAISSDNLNSVPSLSIGRIPSSDLQQCNNFVNKLSNFLLSPVIGAWRDKAILIADDENKSGINEACEINHTKNSDTIYDILSDYMDVKTFYGVEYESEMTSDGLIHSSMNEDIVNEISQGFALINYIGHGDQKKLSAEKILSIDDLPSLSATDKFGLWVVGTCKFGQYDNDECMAEELITSANASIGVISTVRSISSNYNTNFLTYLFNEYISHFNSNNVIRLGDIISLAKNTSYNDNSFYQGYVFHLFGDPALPIFSSKKQEGYDFPNTINLIEQNIVENDLGYDIANLSLSFNDQETNTIIYGNPTNFCDGELSYTTPGYTILNNDFLTTSCFNIPLDAITCNDCDLEMKLYFQNNQDYNGVSYLSNNINLNQQLNNVVHSDTKGPEVSFKYENSTINNNSIIPKNSKIQVSLIDSSGINTFGGIGHNIRYWYNNSIESNNIDLSNFIYSNACEGIGQFEINLPNEFSENQQIFIEAFDNLNNRTLDSISIYIGDKNYDFYIIDKFINVPNPFSDYTYLTFQVPNEDNLPIQTNINIYDLNGQFIKNIKTSHNQKFNSIFWDGKNKANQTIPNGTYLLNINLKSFNGLTQNQTHLISKIK